MYKKQLAIFKFKSENEIRLYIIHFIRTNPDKVLNLLHKKIAESGSRKSE